MSADPLGGAAQALQHGVDQLDEWARQFESLNLSTDALAELNPALSRLADPDGALASQLIDPLTDYLQSRAEQATIDGALLVLGQTLDEIRDLSTDETWLLGVGLTDRQEWQSDGVTLTADLKLGLNLGVDRQVAASDGDAFFVQIDDMRVQIGGDDSGTDAMPGPIEQTFVLQINDPDADGRLTLDELQTTPVAELVTVTSEAVADSWIIEQPAAVATQDAQASELQIVFVDPAVQDYERLYASILADDHYGKTSDTATVSEADNIVVVVLDAERDGITQITETLAGYTDVAGIHILSHGSGGGLQLGSTFLTNDNLDDYRQQLGGWRHALGGGADILLYGCNVASGAWGVDFTRDLSALTGADVAASDDLTGNAELGGDWELEFTVGSIETAPLFQAADYQHVLASITTELPDANTAIFTGSAGSDSLWLRLNDSGVLEYSEDGEAFLSDLDPVTALVQELVLSVDSLITVDLGEADDTLYIDALLSDALTGFAATLDYLGGAGTGDTLVGPALDSSSWAITGSNSGSLNTFITFTGTENLTGAADNEDTFTLGADGSLDGLIDGGAGGFDSLVIEGESYDTVAFTATGPQSGSVDLDGNLVSYAGLEPIDLFLGGTVANVIVDANPFLGDTLVLENNASAGTMQVRSLTGTMEDVSFANPTESLTINLGDGILDVFDPLGTGDDILTLTSFDSGFDAALIINGGAGTDEVIVSQNIIRPGLDINIRADSASLAVADGVTLSTRTIGGSTDYDNAASTGDSGNIELVADFIMAGSGAMLLAHDDRTGIDGGNVTLLANSTIAASPLDLFFDTANAESRVDLQGATLKGATVSVQAIADTSKQTSDTDSPFEKALDGFGLLDFSSFVGVSLSTATAEVRIGSGTTIEADVDALIGATADSESIITTVGLALGFTYASSDATAKASIESGATVTAGNKLRLESTANNNVEASAFGTNSGPTLNIAVTDATSRADAYIQNGASIDAGSLDVAADIINRIETSAKPLELVGDSSGGAFAISFLSSTANAYVDAVITVPGDINISATTDTENNTTASAEPKSAVASIVGEVKEYLSDKQPDEESESEALEVSAALAIAEADATSNAYIGSNAVIRSDGNVSVVSDITDDFRLFSTSEAEEANVALAGAVAIGTTTNTANAYLDAGAQVSTSGRVDVNATTSIPSPLPDDLWAALPSDFWEGVQLALSVEDFVQGVMTTYVRSAAEADDDSGKFALSGSVNLYTVNNNANAWIAENALINQDPNYRSVDQTVAVTASNEIQTVDLAGVFSFAIDPFEPPTGVSDFLGSSGKASLGGSYNEINYNTNTIAEIRAGATVHAEQDVVVTASSNHDAFLMTVAGGQAEKFGISGAFGLYDQVSTTRAQVASGAIITGAALNIASSDDSSFSNVVGGVVLSDSFGVGVSVSINEVTRATDALIGNVAGEEAGTSGTSVDISDDVTIDATSTGNFGAYSLAAAIRSGDEPDGVEQDTATDTAGATSATESKDAGSNDKGNQGKYGLGISGDVSLNRITDNTRAYINDAGTFQADRIALTATSDTDIRSISGAVFFSSEDKSVGLAGSWSEITLAGTTEAWIGGATLQQVNDLSLVAERTGDVFSITAGGAGAPAKGSVTVAGSVSINRITNSTAAYLDAVSGTVSGDIVLSASDRSDLSAIAGAVSFGGKAGVGAAVALNKITNTTTATISGSTLTQTGMLELSAVGEATIETITASAGVSQANAGAAGTVSINEISSTVAAFIIATQRPVGAPLTTGAISLSARDRTTIRAIAGAVGVAKNVGFGAAVAYNAVENSVSAYLEDSGLSTTGNLSLVAESEGLIETIAAGVGGGKTLGLTGSVTLNSIANTVDAHIGNGAVVQAGDISLSASDGTGASGIRSLAGALALGGKASAGAAVAINDIANTFAARIDDATVTATSGEVNLNSTSSSSIESAAVGVSGAGNFALGGSVSLNDIANTVEASITGGATVNAGSVSLATSDSSTIESFAGGVAGASSAAFGAAVATNEIDNTITARVDGATVNTPGALMLSATSDATIRNITVGGSGASTFALGGSVSLNDISNTVEAVISGGADVTTGSMSLAVADISTIEALAGGVAGAGSAAIGAAVATNEIDNAITASIDAATVSATGDLSLSATSAAGLDTLAVGGAVSGSFSGAGSVSLNDIANTVEASITGNATVDADSMSLAATDTSTIEAEAGGVAGAGSVAIGAAVATNEIDNTITASVDAATVTTTGALSLSATSAAGLDTLAVGGSGAGTFALGGSVSLNDIANTVEASITGGATVDSGSMSLAATDTSTIEAEAGGVAGAGSVAIGAAVATNEIDNTITASVDAATVTTTGALSLSTTSAAGLDTLAVGGAVSGTFAGAGSVSLNDITNTVEASITGNATVDADSISLTAADISTIEVKAGGVAGAGAVAIGAAVATNDIDNTVKALVDGSTVTATGALSISATSDTAINSTTVGGAISGTFSGAGSVSLNDIANTVEASITNGATVGAVSISLAAADTSTIEALAGGVAGAGAVAIGAAVATNDIDNTVKALVDGSTVTVTGALGLSATSDTTISSTTVGGAGAGTFAAGGSVSLNYIANTVEAAIIGAAIVDAGSISLTTNDTSEINAIAGTGAGAGVAAVGAAVTENDIGNTIKARIDGATVTVAGELMLSATSGATIDSTTVAGVGSTIALGGSISLTDIENTVEAFISGGAIVAAGSVSLLSRSNNKAISSTNGIVIGGVALGFVKSTANDHGTTSAFLDGIGLLATDELSLLASGTSTASALALAASGGVIDASRNIASADAAPTVTAYVSGAGTHNVAGTTDIMALALGGSDATVIGTGGGGVRVSSSDAEAKWRPTVNAYIGDGTTLMSGGDVTIQAFNNYDEDGVLQPSNKARAEAIASGGGLASIPGSEADVTIDASVSANVGTGATLTAGDDVVIVSKSRNFADADAIGVSVGGVSVGSNTARATLSNESLAGTAHGTGIADGATLIAGGDITVRSDSDNKADVDTVSGSGGVVDVSGGKAIINMNRNLTQALIGDWSRIDAAGTLGLYAHNKGDLRARTSQDLSIGLLSFIEVKATVDINSQTTASIGDHTSIDVGSLDIEARDTGFDIDAITFSKTYQAAGTSKATSLVDANLTTLAHIGEGAQITAPELIRIISRQDNIQSNTTANTEIAGGLTGSLTSIANNTLVANSNVMTETGSLLQTRELYVEASTPTVRGGYVRIADTDADTVVNFIWDVVGETCKTVWTIITFGLWDGKEICEPVMGWVREITNSDENGIRLGSENRNSTIVFNSEVVLQGPDNPVLEIDENGNVVTAEGFTIDDTDGETLGPVMADTIVVNDIFNDAVGKLSIISPTGTIRGDAIFNFRETFESSLIVNDSDKDISIGTIEVWNKNKSGQDINIQVGDQSNFVRDRAGSGYQLITSFADSTVDIINNGSGDIILTGVIDNPGGTTSLYNAGGDIASNSGELHTRSVSIETLTGSVGSLTAPIVVQLLQGEGLGTDFTLRSAQDLFVNIKGVVNNDQPFVSLGKEVTAGGIAQVNFLDSSRQSLDAATATLTLSANTADLLVDLVTGATGDSHSFRIGEGIDPADSVEIFDPGSALEGGQQIFEPVGAQGDLFDPQASGVNPFDTAAVDSDTINFPAPHGFITGQAVVYSTGGGDPIEGLSDGETYYVVVTASTGLQLAATLDDALAGTPVVLALNAALATGSEHRLNSRYRIDLGVEHGLVTGEAIRYSAGGGGSIGGLGDGDTYYAVVVDATSIRLAATFDDAVAADPVVLDVNLPVADGQEHSFSSLARIDLGSEHRFATGEAVRYSNGGGDSIGGLVDGEIYHVVVVDADSIALSPTRADATDVNPVLLTLGVTAATGSGHGFTSLETLDLGTTHGFTTGQAVIYDAGDAGSASIGNLADGGIYYVVVVDETTVKLAETRADAEAAVPVTLALDGSTALGSMHSLASQDVIDLGQVHGFATGQAVTYSNGGGVNESIGGLVDGQTYYVVAVDATSVQLSASEADALADTPVVLSLDFSTATGVGHSFSALFDPDIAVDIDNDIIDLGFAHGLVTGDAVVYSSGGGDAIGGLVDGNTYYAVVIDFSQIALVSSAEDALAAVAEIEIKFERIDFGGPLAPVVNVEKTQDGIDFITVQLNTNPGNESTAQELVEAINASPLASALITAQLEGDGDVEVATNISVDTGERGRVLTGRGEPQVLEFIDSNLIDEAQTGSYVIQSAGTGDGELAITGATNDIVIAGVVDFESITISTAGNILGDNAGHLLTATDIALSANGSVGVGTASNAIRTDLLGGQIDITARNAVYLTETAGNLNIGEISSLNGAVRLTSETAAIVDADDDGGPDINAPGAVLLAVTGIGESTNALETTLDNLEADAGSGGIWIVNTGALTIGGITGVDGLSADGPVVVTTLSPLTVTESITTSGDIALTAMDSAADNDDVVVTNDADITSTGGSVTIRGGDSVHIDTGSVITAAGQVTILADQGDADDGGGTVVIEGTILANAAVIEGSVEADTIVITNIVTPTTVLAGGGSDTIYVGSNATTTSNSGGNVDGIAALLFVDGGEGTDLDLLDVDDSGDAGDNTGTLTGTTLSGLGMASGIHIQYEDIDSLAITLGSGDDTFHVLSTHSGNSTLATGAGEDTVNIQAISGDTSVDTGADDDTLNVGSTAPAGGGVIDGIDAQLSLEGGSDSDTLNVDDSGDTSDNLGTLTESTLTGLGMGGGLDYSGIDILNLDLGSGDDRLNVRGTSAVTNLDTAQGDDLIYVSSGADLGALGSAPADGDLEALHERILHGSLDAVTGTLNIEAGAGQNTLGVSDREDSDADANVILTATSIQGLATATISYIATGGDFSGQGAWALAADRGLFGRGINIYAGSGGNRIEISGTASDSTLATPFAKILTSVFSGGGADQVHVAVTVVDDGGRLLAIYGEGGNDSLDGRDSALPLVMFGGDDDDTLHASALGDYLFGDAGRDTLVGGDSGDYLLGDEGGLYYLVPDGQGNAFDIVLGSLGASIGSVTGGDSLFLAPDLVTSIAAADDANDAILGGAGADRIIGGGNDDTAGDPVTETLDGEAGADIVYGDHARAGLVNGLLTQIASIDHVLGGADNITGSAGNDVLLGGFGGDSINDTGDNNIVLGDDGRVVYDLDGDLADIDLLESTSTTIGGGVDDITAGPGNDIVIGGRFGDSINAGEGNNLVIGDSGRIIAMSTGSAQLAGQPLVFGTLETIATDDGGDDTVTTGTGNDLILGGAGGDTVYAGAGHDIALGDNGRLVYDADGNAATLDSVETTAPADGGGDTVYGGAGNDLLAGGADADMLYGGNGVAGGTVAGTDFDVILGDNGEFVAIENQATQSIQRIETTDIATGTGGNDRIEGNEDDDIILGGVGADLIDGNAGDDLILGDNGRLDSPAAGESSPRYRVLTGAAIYGDGLNGGADGEALIDTSTQYGRPGGAERWANFAITPDDGSGAPHGADSIAGGADDDTLFGQGGNDTVQGDGSITLAISAGRDADGLLVVSPSVEDFDGAGSDGDDYIEGNAGDDLIFGNLGQDDIIGGSSSLFGLNGTADGADLIFGGAGTDIARNHAGDGSETGHAADADMILGDNGNIYRLVGTQGVNGGAFLSFTYDNYSTAERIIVRAAELLDYTPGGIDYDQAASADLGTGDEIHGESGDDFIYGMAGNDLLFGEGQDDDLIGGYGHDWIAGGTGSDGVLGDDGRIYTSRNSTIADESLYGIDRLDAVDVLISTPGKIQQATINVDGALKKTVNLTPFNVDPDGDMLFEATQGNDIIYGGLGDDFLHGGVGDDAISGATALTPFYDAPENSGNVLRYGEERAGEFAAYNEFDPLRKILVDDNGVFTEDGSGSDFLLNFDAADSGAPMVGTGPDGVTPVYSDGNDVIFGDLGNDWLVGGTGQDHLFGGWGDDLLNADDDHDSTAGSSDPRANNIPDGPVASYEDIAFGGAGRDVLIANTGGDRLIDWVGQFNSYLVPFAPFGPFTISRAPQPQIAEYLYALGASDGADPTIFADTGSGQDRNGEPYAELGVVIQKDFEWQEQTGAPDDPLPGNIPGGPRDVMQSATFNTGTSEAFAADSGSWTLQQGRLEVTPEVLGADAVSVYHVNDYLPGYFELQATINAGKPTAGFKSNAFLIFDYQSPTDFKYAGINISNDKLEIGYRDATGWHEVVQDNARLKPDRDYNVLLSVNGTTVTLVVNNRDVLSYAFAPRVDADGFSYGLNAGMVGIGATNSKARIDNVKVQVLPPEITYAATEDFSGANSRLLAGDRLGTWLADGGRYLGTPDLAGAPAVSLTGISVAPASVLELEALVNTSATGGLVFDYYDAEHFKFVALTPATGEVVIGHHTAHGWAIDATVDRGIKAGKDYSLELKLVGRSVSVILDGQVVLGHLFNSLVVDGDSGLISKDGGSVFDDFSFRTNDPAFLTEANGDALLAGSGAEAGPVSRLGSDGLQPVMGAVVQRWSDLLAGEDLIALDDINVRITDLDGDLLGLTVGDTIYIDSDAAGHGWFVDETPQDDAEFDNGTALSGSEADGRMDLLSVLMHEYAHVLGFEHDSLLSETLDAGTRIVPVNLGMFSDLPQDADDSSIPLPGKTDAGTRALLWDEWQSEFREWKPGKGNTRGDMLVYDETSGRWVRSDEGEAGQSAHGISNVVMDRLIDWRDRVRDMARH